jgi:hypothetical protein
VGIDSHYEQGFKEVKKVMKSFFFIGTILCLLLSNSVGWAQSLDSSEIITILNLSRESIRSGDIRILSIETKRRSAEYITGTERYLKEIAPQAMPGYMFDHKDEIFSYMLKKEEENAEEQHITFEVNIGVPSLELSRYKIVKVDRRPLNPLRGVGHFVHAGSYRVVTYDGELGAEEIDSPYTQSLIGLYYSMPEPISFHLFGRSQRQIPPDAQINSSSTTAGGEQTYQIRFPFQIRDGVFGQCKLFVDPKRGFAVVREENFYEGAIFFSVDYSEFKEIDSIPYPTRIQMKEYQKTKLMKQTTIEVKEGVFNVTFPSDFFTVDRKASPYQDVLEISTVPLISK